MSPALRPDAFWPICCSTALSTLFSAAPPRCWRLRRSRVRGLALLPALVTVLVNAAVVGLELALFYSPDRTFAAALLPAMLGVGAGELVSCLVLGVAMVRVIEASPTLRRLAEGEKV